MAEHRDVSEGLVARWRELSPVRLALYPAVVTIVALLVGYGVLAAERAPLWLAAVAALLGVGGTEGARLVAYSPNSVRGIVGNWHEHAADEYARGVADAVHATPDRIAAGNRRCGDVRGGRRCELGAGHEGGHLIRTE